MFWLRQRQQKADPKTDTADIDESKDNIMPELVWAPLHEKDSTVAVPEIGEPRVVEMASESYVSELQ
jgi:hypothetical protein